MGFFSRLAGAAGGFLTGGPIGAIGGFAGDPFGGGGGSDAQIARIPNSVIPGGRSFSGGGGCNPPLVRDNVGGGCVFPGSPGDLSTGGRAGSSTAVANFGGAVMGRFGAGMVPATRSTLTKFCPPGAVLGSDELCYNRSDISKKDRKWNPGRPPLLTGGERNAITKAAAAARKIQRTEKQLQKLGMLKTKSRPRARALPAPRRQLAAGGGDTIVVG